MKLIRNTNDLSLNQILAVTRDCSISSRFVTKDTLVQCIAVDSIDEFDIAFSNLSDDGAGVGIPYCNNNPRFRVAYKNEEKLWRY